MTHPSVEVYSVYSLTCGINTCRWNWKLILPDCTHWPVAHHMQVEMEAGLPRLNSVYSLTCGTNTCKWNWKLALPDCTLCSHWPLAPPHAGGTGSWSYQIAFCALTDLWHHHMQVKNGSWPYQILLCVLTDLWHHHMQIELEAGLTRLYSVYSLTCGSPHGGGAGSWSFQIVFCVFTGLWHQHVQVELEAGLTEVYELWHHMQVELEAGFIRLFSVYSLSCCSATCRWN